MIVFDEKTVAEKLLSGKAKGETTSQGNLNILGRYFKWQGMDAHAIQKCLIEYCQKSDPTFNEILMSKKIEYGVISGISFPLRLNHPVQISKGEMTTIRSLGDIKLEKLLFMMLAVAKYFNHKENEFYFSGTDSDLFRLARLGNLRKQERVDALFYLNTHSCIKVNLLGSYRVVIAEGLDFPPNDVQVIIENVEKAMDYFPWQCPACGNEILGRPKRRNMCDDCYALKRTDDVRKNVKKTRENSKKI